MMSFCDPLTNNPAPPASTIENDFQVTGPLPFPGSAGAPVPVVLNLIGVFLVILLREKIKLENRVNIDRDILV